MIQVFVIAPSPLACDALATALNGESDIAVAGRAVGYRVQPAQLPSSGIVLLDVGFVDAEPPALMKAIRRDRPGLEIVVVGVPDSPGIILNYLESGAHGFVRRDESISGLVEQVRAVARGELHLSPVLAGLLIRRIGDLSRLCSDRGIDPSRTAALSVRERQVLDEIARGRGNQEISRRLGIGIGTVKNHVHSILRKLNVDSREDAGLYWRLFRESAAGDRPAGP